MNTYIPQPGDLTKYMSRTLLIISDPYPANVPLSKLWVDSIEIDDNTFRKVRCDTLTLIQGAKEKTNG